MAPGHDPARPPYPASLFFLSAAGGYVPACPTSRPPVPAVSAAAARFLEGYRMYGTIRAGCEAAGVTPYVVRKWMAARGTFRQDMQDALADFRESLEGLLIDDIEQGRDNPDLRRRLRAAWPEKYGRA